MQPHCETASITRNLTLCVDLISNKRNICFGQTQTPSSCRWGFGALRDALCHTNCLGRCEPCVYRGHCGLRAEGCVRARLWRVRLRLLHKLQRRMQQLLSTSVLAVGVDCAAVHNPLPGVLVAFVCCCNLAWHRRVALKHPAWQLCLVISRLLSNSNPLLSNTEQLHQHCPHTSCLV